MSSPKAKIPRISHAVLPVEKLFIDEVKCRIFADAEHPSGRREMHAPERSDGYQRDPFKRKQWAEKQSNGFGRALFRELEVSERKFGNDAMYAVIDGGGRWLMAQLIGLKAVECRVHHDLTREEEARLFWEFDALMVGVGAVDSFRAKLASGDHQHKTIAKQILPYEVGPRNPKHLFSVGPLKALWRLNPDKPGVGLKIMQRTALACYNTWGPGNNNKAKALNVPGHIFAAIALMFENLPRGFNEGVLRSIMNDPAFTPGQLILDTKREFPGINTTKIGIESAIFLAKRYNRKRKAESDPFDLTAIRLGDLASAFQNRFQFTSNENAEEAA